MRLSLLRLRLAKLKRKYFAPVVEKEDTWDLSSHGGSHAGSRPVGSTVVCANWKSSDTQNIMFISSTLITTTSPIGEIGKRTWLRIRRFKLMGLTPISGINMHVWYKGYYLCLPSRWCRFNSDYMLLTKILKMKGKIKMKTLMIQRSSQRRISQISISRCWSISSATKYNVFRNDLDVRYNICTS